MSKEEHDSDMKFIDGVIAEHQMEVDRLEKKIKGDFLLNSDSDPTHRTIRKHKDLIRVARERQSYLKREQLYIADRIRMDKQRKKEYEMMTGFPNKPTTIKKKKKKRVNLKKGMTPTYESYGSVVDKSKATKTHSHSVSANDVRKYMKKTKKKKKKKDNFLTMALPIINKGVEKLNLVKKED